MSPTDRVLSRLVNVRRRQPGQYSACCPAHEDRAPSLSVRETPDGTVLLHCFAGCEVADVLAALGIEPADLFPLKDTPANTPARISPLLTASHALALLHDEAQFVAVCAGNIAYGVALSEPDLQRVLQSAGRIAYIRDEVMR